SGAIAASVHVAEPVLELGHAARRNVEVGLTHLQGEFARLAAADGAAVDGGDRGDLGGRADHEHLVGGVELVAGDHGGVDAGAQPLGDLDDRVAGDAAQVHGVGDG